MSNQGRSFNAVDHKRKMNEKRAKEPKAPKVITYIPPIPISLQIDKPNVDGTLFKWMAPSDGTICNISLFLSSLDGIGMLDVIRTYGMQIVTLLGKYEVLVGMQELTGDIPLKKGDRITAKFSSGEPVDIWLSFHWVGGV